jgi:hypothetical protein
VQQASLHGRKIQPIEQLEEVIEEIEEMMLKSVEEYVIQRKLERRKPTRLVGQQQHQGRGVGGNLQRRVWDPT